MTIPSPLRMGDYLESSSLDPLAASVGCENVDPQHWTRSSPIRLPQPSPGKGLRITEDFSLFSPHAANRQKSNAASSSSRKVSHQNLSPWKIRVTVEAEPEEVQVRTRQTTTRTMKVPLWDDSPSTEAITGKGQRSQAGSPGAKRRSTTYRGARSSSRTRRQSVTDLGITVLGDEEDHNEWSPHKAKKRSRPRSKKEKQEQQQQQQQQQQPQQQALLYGARLSLADGQNLEETRNISKDSVFPIRPDSDAEDSLPVFGEMEADSPQLRKIDLNKVSVRSRSGPPKGPKSRHKKEDSNRSPLAIQPPALVLDTATVTSKATATSYPTPSSSIQDDVENVQNSPGDRKEQHEGSDTILESEGFTMIDLDSIPSARHFVSPPYEQHEEKAGDVETLPNKPQNDDSCSGLSRPMSLPPISSPGERSQSIPRTTAIPPHLNLAEEESDLSSTIPSSPPVLAQPVAVPNSKLARPQTRPTPSPYSSPSLPSPPRASACPLSTQLAQTQKSTPPTLARVVRAGIALQGVLSPKITSGSHQMKDPRAVQGTPKQRLDELFEGFDSGTRRELRAGLRFGEELAKRQKSSFLGEIARETKVSSNTQIWRGETTVRHTPITLPGNARDMVENSARQTSTAAPVEVKSLKGVGGSLGEGLRTPIQAKCQVADSTYRDTQAKEHEWQLERAAVSRQIQNANMSQAIILSSDGVDEEPDGSAASNTPAQGGEEDEIDGAKADETCGDIWLAEAEAHNSSQHHTREPFQDILPSIEPERQRERAKRVINGARRSLIPSPWKRGEDVDGASTFTTNSDLSGLLWKHPSRGVRFGAGAIKRQGQGSSNAFGSESQGTPFQTREGIEDAKNPAAGRDESIAEDEVVGSDDLRLGETGVEQDDYSEDGTRDPGLKSSSQVDDRNESHQDENGTPEDSSTPADSSLPPQPIKIPVKFNDSTISALPLTSSFPPSSSQPSRPSTPRSALKGSRHSLGLEDISARKVVFSSQSLCVDEDGQKSNSRIKSLSPTPPPATDLGVVNSLQPALPLPALTQGIPQSKLEVEPEPASKSWFGWLFRSTKGFLPDPLSAPSSLVVPPSSTNIASVDGPSDSADADLSWVTTKSTIPASSRNRPPATEGLPSFLLPPSYPSDPARDVTVPLATSGEFTDVHFRTLHIIYRKSLRRSFHAPKAIRPELQKMIGENFSCDEGEYGHFAWEVDQDAVIVVERFMTEVEFGWEGKGAVEWRWSEKELCGRLFRIIVGEEVRREQSWRGQEGK